MTMRPRHTLPDTHYSRTAACNSERPSAHGNLTEDVAIIGGGLAGLTLARELASKGLSPVLIEANAIGYGASGRNGGFVSPGFACDQAAIERRVGQQAADALFQLSIDGVHYVRARISDAGDAAGIAKLDGILAVRRTPGAEDFRAKQEWLSRFGWETTFMDVDAVREVLNSKRYFEALRSCNSFHIHPLNYARALARDAEALGACIYEGTPAIELRAVRDGFVITTPDAAIKAGQVVVTTGGYTGDLVPALRHSYVPVATYVMASEPAPEMLAQAIKTRDGISDTRQANNYFRLMENGDRLVWGGAMTVKDRDPSAVTRYLRRELVESFPQLAGLEVEVSWSGWMSYARHKMPQIGQISPGLWYATAFGGHGLNTTAIAGQIMAEAVTGQSDRWRMFAPWGLGLTGGPIGRAAAQATYRWMAWNDRRREAAVL